MPNDSDQKRDDNDRQKHPTSDVRVDQQLCHFKLLI